MQIVRLFVIILVVCHFSVLIYLFLGYHELKRNRDNWITHYELERVSWLKL